MKRFMNFCGVFLKWLGYKVVGLGNAIVRKTPSYKISKMQGEDLYLIKGIYYKLNKNKFIDSCLITNGVFEKQSTAIVQKLCKPNMSVLDIGANFGYYSILFSKLVGKHGKVYSLEPVKEYYEKLRFHIKKNNCSNVFPYKIGFSNKTREANIYLGTDSATLKWADESKNARSIETIKLVTLDDWVEKEHIDRVDFIKVDIDGHEPQFLEGAIRTLKNNRPILLMEFAELNLYKTGTSVENLAQSIKNLNYILISEKSFRVLSTDTDFLIEAKNCAFSANILCVPNELVGSISNQLQSSIKKRTLG